MTERLSGSQAKQQTQLPIRITLYVELTMASQKISATSRRVLSNLAHRKVDWSADVWKAAPIVHNVNQFRAWVATADAQAEKYKSAPSPIDFAGAKKNIRDSELVDMMESFYKGAKVPAETHEWDAEDKAHKEGYLSQVEEQAAFYADLKDDLVKEIAFQKSTKTTADTTVYDYMCNNPTIHEEIEDEIERREWFKDIGLNAK